MTGEISFGFVDFSTGGSVTSSVTPILTRFVIGLALSPTVQPYFLKRLNRAGFDHKQLTRVSLSVVRPKLEYFSFV